MNLLLEEAWSYRYKDWPSCLEKIHDAYTLAKAADKPNIVLKVLVKRSIVSPDALPLHEALSLNKESIKFYQDNALHQPKAYAKILFNTARIYKSLGKHDQAIDLLFITNKIYQEEDPYMSWVVFGQLGQIYRALQRNSEAMGYFTKALSLVREGDNKFDYGYQLIMNISFCQQIKDYLCYSDLVSEYQEYKGIELNWYTSNHHLNFFIEEGHSGREKIEELKNQLIAHEERKNLFLAAQASFEISKEYQSLNLYEDALRYAKKAINIYDRTSSIYESAKYYKNVYDILNSRKNYEEALKYYILYDRFSDSLTTIGVQQNLNEIQTKYETNEKQQEIELLSAQNELKDQRIQLGKKNLFLSFLGIVLVSIFSLSIYRSRSKIRLLNEVLERQKQELSKGLSEKEFLLKEIHHRVKNNLQVISSLLKLQSDAITDTKAQRALEEGRNRVRSMAIIHQNLYKENNLSGINMNEYLSQLSRELLDSYKIMDNRISLDLQVEDIFLDVDTAVPIGLIINELVSNSFKHAFPGGKNGRITIQLANKSDILHLKVSDDGVGFDRENIRKGSFGHDLIEAFAERLQAEYQLDGNNGTSAIFRIVDFKLAA